MLRKNNIRGMRRVFESDPDVVRVFRSLPEGTTPLASLDKMRAALARDKRTLKQLRQGARAGRFIKPEAYGGEILADELAKARFARGATAGVGVGSLGAAGYRYHTLQDNSAED